VENQARLEAALHSVEPEKELFRLVRNLLEAGCERAEVQSAFAAARERLLLEGEAELAELVIDALDSLTGWCRLD
jgi:hypothetical protein